MNRRRGFTLIELLVVIAIIGLLMSILLPALKRVKQQARTVACLANIRQWAVFFSMYTQDYDGKFQPGVGADHTYHWFNTLRPYYHNNHKLCCCPTATKPLDGNGDGVADGRFNTFSAWGVYTLARYGGGYDPGGDWGSYGINGWVENPPSTATTVYEGFETIYSWRTPNVKGAGYVPLFMDSLRFNVFPRETDNPPTVEDAAWESTQHMRRICINRHDGYINMAFLDWSAKKVGLKEMWTLRWHKAYNTSGPWTSAGGVMPADWPQWMRSLPDY